jgi:hypothetical protein
VSSMRHRVASGWENSFLTSSNIFIHGIDEFKANEIDRLIEQYLLCACAYLVGLEI